MDDNLSPWYKVGGKKKRRACPPLYPWESFLGIFLRGLGGKAVFLQEGRKNWLFLRG